MAQSIEDAKAEKDGSNQLDGSQFRAFVRLHAEAEERCKIANEARKKLRKEMKAAGLNLGDFDAINRMTDWSRDEVAETFDRRAQYARFMNLPVGSQGSLFDDEKEAPKPVSEETQNDVAFAKGYQAGIRGAERKPPEEFAKWDQDWLKGYSAGQDSIALDMIQKKGTT